MIDDPQKILINFKTDENDIAILSFPSTTETARRVLAAYYATDDIDVETLETVALRTSPALWLVRLQEAVKTTLAALRRHSVGIGI